MNTILKLSVLLSGICVILLTITSCGEKSTATPTPPIEKPDPNKNTGIQISQDTNFKSVLTDSVGRALYYFSNDSKGASTCTRDCLTNWPIYYSDRESTDANLDKSKVGVITRADGKKQSTYKGWPLYYWKDDKAKEIKGDGVGGIWFVAKPDYKLMVVNAQLNANNTNYKSDYTLGLGTTLYLTDDEGRSLYFYGDDKFEKNNFTNANFSNNPIWPIYEKEIGELPSAVKTADIKVITVHGKKQLTYKGRPLYYWQNDKARGDNLGFLIGGVGTLWPIAKLNATAAPR